MNLDYEELREALASRPGALQPPAGYQRAGVCLPLFDRGESKVLAIQKTDTQGYRWRNQIALPGGHATAEDRSLTETALRELDEELGIDRSDIVVLGDLGHFQTATSKTNLSVTVGRWSGHRPLRTDTREIARVLEVPLADLLRLHVSRGFRSRPPEAIGDALVYPVPYARIWGITARILHTLVEIVLDHPSMCRKRPD
ncbi:MAG: CoA pyrophosphatase [Phycisphaerales bacterium]|nr:MAG: CoA pyrophosphatase [Phycisphaerales bacterium]